MIYEPTIIIKPEVITIDETARIDGFCKLEGGDGIRIGAFVHIASFSHINVGGGTTIFERHSTCSSHCCIGSASPDWNYLFASAAEPRILQRKRKFVTKICEYAILFMNVTVLPGRTVGEGAVVLPGTLVDRDVEPWQIVQGNPYRVVGQREIYEYRSSFFIQERDPLSGEVLRADVLPSDTTSTQWTQSEINFRLR